MKHTRSLRYVPSSGVAICDSPLFVLVIILGSYLAIRAVKRTRSLSYYISLCAVISNSILMWSCSILTFTLSCSQRHSSSHRWLTSGWFRWFRWRVLTGDSQIVSTWWISHIMTVSIIHFKCTQLIALGSRCPPALNPPVHVNSYSFLSQSIIITIIAFIDHGTPDYISHHFVPIIFIKLYWWLPQAAIISLDTTIEEQPQ